MISSKQKIFTGVFFILAGLVVFGVNKFGRSKNLEDLEEIKVTISKVPKCIKTRNNNTLEHTIFLKTKEYENSTFLIHSNNYNLSNAKKAVILKPDDIVFITIHHEDFSKIKTDTVKKRKIHLYGIRSKNEIFFKAEDKIKSDKSRTKRIILASLIFGIIWIILGLYRKKFK